MAEEQLNSALNLMRRMPPNRIENSLAGLMELAPQLTDDLLTHVDQPLKLRKDTKTGKDYVLCDYNRDGDSYRSPWSNQYFPAYEEGLLPDKRLREMETEANSLFDRYRHMYFEGGVSSVYYFKTDEKDSNSFGACFLIHKDVDVIQGLKKGVWDSVHVFEATKSKSGQSNYDYKLTTTVLISMLLESKETGDVDLSGSLSKQETKTGVVVDKEHTHIGNMGRMLEEMELAVRNSIEGIYIQKTREIFNGIRALNGPAMKGMGSLHQNLSAVLANKKKD